MKKDSITLALTIVVSIAIILYSCAVMPVKDNEVTQIGCDTVYLDKEVPVLDMVVIDSLLTLNEELKRINDSISLKNDTLGDKLLHARLVINQMKVYTNIVSRNPSQVKFLKGWINRATEGY